MRGGIIARTHYSTDTENGYWGLAWPEDVQPDGTTKWSKEPDVSTDLRTATGATTCRAIAKELMEIADLLEADGFTD